ncbi:MAG: ABC transporter substrate-binding protein [Aestuariivita sp.]|nr:ABC transporter substrate-binding protein [Aestuariivita sp.]MCY4204041.1 ABC transporter substrate-binding protein [Aestuariivita sp.]MCY4287833.1 ABC transporter substrate-binding protein [Aestuariivita sp.]MCY4345333.1 ABC transporter substrate-binding protein [Aestuariivita sp.]
MEPKPKRSILLKGLIASTALVVTSLAAAAEEVTVGVLVPLTGELGEFGKIVAGGVELGANEINAAGGTSCGNIRLVVADTGGNPEVGIREASKMIESENAVAVLGPTSGVMVALVDLAKRTKTVIMSPYAGTITLNELGGDFVYRTVSSDLGDGAASGLWLKERGYKSVAFLVQNEESTISPAQVARTTLEDAGIELTDFIVYNPGQPSYQAELISVLANEPDAIYLAGGQESGVTVIKEATSGGFEGEWLFTADLAVPEIFDAAGADLLNGRAYVEFADADNSLPEYKAFEALHQEKAGGDPGPFAANSYDMIKLVALSLEASGVCSGEGINSVIRDVSDGGETVSSFAEGKAALAEGKDINYEGASGPLVFDPSGTVAGAYTIQKAEGGEWVNEKFYPASAFE